MKIMMNNQKGVIAPLTAILLVVFLGFVALSVDVGYLVASKNELQNAADAGALAGANELYSEDGTGVNTGCNEIAYNAARQNVVAKDDVEINGGFGNTAEDDIQRGHWSFATGEFTRSDNLTIDLMDENNNYIPKEVLDADVDFVNAVQVTVRRETNPITLFFAKIFGQSDAKMSATAVAYIGFVGKFNRLDFDAPVALCEEHLRVTNFDPTDPRYECGVAVWFEAAETALWTTLNQDTNPNTGNCISGNTTNVRDVLTGNTDVLYTGKDLGAQDSVNDALHKDLYTDVWYDESIRDSDERYRKVVKWNLPIVICDSNTCVELVGVVSVEILWYNIDSAEAKMYEKAPYEFYEADNADGTRGEKIFDASEVVGLDPTDDIARWNAFATEVGLVDDAEVPLPIEKNQIYFKASCDTNMDPLGGPGGENFGLLSKTPVLVD